MSPPSSPFIHLGPDIFPLILRHLACEPLNHLSTDAYRRILPFAIACTHHYNLTRQSVAGLRVLPLHYTVRTTRTPIPPYPTALYRIPQPWGRQVKRPAFSPISEQDLVHAVANFPALISLHLFRTTKLTDSALTDILTRIPGLRDLRISTNHQVTVQSLRVLPTCTKLQTLDLSYCSSLGDEIAPFIAQIPALNSLNVAYWPISDAFVQTIAPSSTITHLDISACSRLTSRSCHYLPAMPSLQKLHFRCSARLEDSAILSLSQCPNLQTIDLSLAKNITDHLLAPLSNRNVLPLLNTLRLSNCSLLTDTALSYLVDRRITHLDLSHCQNLSDRAVEYISRMPCLNDIDLSGCTFITDNGVSILSNIPSLRFLRLAYCNGITDNAIPPLKSSKIRFDTIDVRSCCAITQDGFKSLEKLCENLQKTPAQRLAVVI